MKVIGTYLEILLAGFPTSGIFLDGEEVSPPGADGRSRLAAKIWLAWIVGVELCVEMGLIVESEDIHRVPELLL